MKNSANSDLSFTAQQQKWYDEACSRIDQNRLKQLIFDLTSKHSPTGAEREASEFMVDYMNNAGIEAYYQPITEISGNCVGRVRGSGSGPSLLLYAPVDTLLEGDPVKDLPCRDDPFKEDSSCRDVGGSRLLRRGCALAGGGLRRRRVLYAPRFSW